MSTDSSPSPDGVDKSKKNRSRKPDIQLYVPRGKRIENQVKQKLNTEKDANKDLFMNIIDTSMNNNDSQCQWKPNPAWFSNETPYLTKEHSDETTSNVVDEPLDVTDRADFSPKDGRSGKNWRAKYGRSSQEDDYSFIQTMTFQRQPSGDKFRKPPLPQPDRCKLPHRQIEAMLKMYNITKETCDDDEKKCETVLKRISLDDVTSSSSSSATNINEILRSNVPCSLKLPDETPTNGVDDADDDASPSSSCWLTADAVDLLTGANDVFTLPFDVDVAKTNDDDHHPILLNQNEADSILDSLPTSYDEFETKDLITKKQGQQQHDALSTQCSTSPMSSVPRTPVSLVGGGIDSIERTSSSSPSMIDPDDLEVQLINESFEEQLKQAQVLSNAKTKEAFYRQPNQETSASTSNNSSSANLIAKEKSFKTNNKQSKDIVVVEHNIQSSSSSSSRNDAKEPKLGLTWAGWGAGAAPGSDNGSTSKNDNQLHSAIVSNSTLTVLTKKSSSGSSSSSLDTSAPILSSMKQYDDYQETNDMDELSKAMIDKILSCDDDDDDLMKLGANKVVVTKSASKKHTANETKSSFDDECLHSKPSCAVNTNDTWSSSSTNAASVADSWEDILDPNLVPELNSAVDEEASLDDLPKIDYLQFKPKDITIDDKEFGHVLEAYDFPSDMKSETLHLAMQQLACKHFKIQWVDETHALIICTDQFSANVVLDGSHPVIKLRPLSHASAQSKRKAKEVPEMLRSYKPKPETNAFVARRLVESHLGKKTTATSDRRMEERKKIERAKEQKKFIAQMRDDVWEGKV